MDTGIDKIMDKTMDKNFAETGFFLNISTLFLDKIVDKNADRIWKSRSFSYSFFMARMVLE